MLVRLFGNNFRSFKNPFELSMVAADLTRKEDRDRGVIEVAVDGLDEPLSLLRVVAIYGANASGKSNLLRAGQALSRLVTDSHPRLHPLDVVFQYDPFKLDEASRSAPIELGCDVIHESSLLRYEVQFGVGRISRETLSILRGDREIKLIDRQPSGEVKGTLFKAKASPNRLYVKEMQPSVSVLAKLAMFGPNQGKDSVRPYYEAICNATRFADYTSAVERLPGEKPDHSLFNENTGYRSWIMSNLIQAADLGIGDVAIKTEHSFFLDLDLVTKKAPSFVHNGQSNQPLEFDDESSGTKKLYHIAGDWWTLANEPVTLFADELSASLHPRLLDRLIRAVNEAPSDRVRSQLVFTTHDTGLMESQDGRPPALRRDQIYFTRKDAVGASQLYSLAEFKDDARPVHNIRKRYMSGLYGAIPSVEKLSL